MSLSRRQFFGRFLRGGKDAPGGPSPKRLARYEVLETYARTQLLPYDFALMPQQERELIARVRTLLENTSDDTLFSQVIRGEIEELVQTTIEPWRHRSNLTDRAERIAEIRLVAPDYVSNFITDPANVAVLEQIKQTYRIDDFTELEGVLREQIQSWINQADDRLLEQCDVVSVKDLVFAQLRSWC